MSFVTKKYQTDAGDVAQTRLSAQIAVLAGAEPAAAVTTPFFVKVSKGNREFGIRPRYALYSLSTAVGTRTFKTYLRIPKLTTAALAASPATVTYKGDDYDLAVLVKEDY